MYFVRRTRLFLRGVMVKGNSRVDAAKGLHVWWRRAVRVGGVARLTQARAVRRRKVECIAFEARTSILEGTFKA